MSKIHGPLYYERTGRVGPVLALLPPNPMDQATWVYQMQHFSTWFRCMAIDTPGYGRSPSADDGVTADEIAEAFWDAIDEVEPDEKVILGGCSGGFIYSLIMAKLRPERTAAIVLTGCGLIDDSLTKSRINSYGTLGAEFRKRHLHMDYSPAFNATPMSRYFAEVFTERNDLLDIPTMLRQFKALGVPDPDLPPGVKPMIPPESALSPSAPVLIITGTEDWLHGAAFDLQAKIAGCELQIMPGAGHACQMEQPWLFDDILIGFLEKHGLMKRSEPAR